MMVLMVNLLRKMAKFKTYSAAILFHNEDTEAIHPRFVVRNTISICLAFSIGWLGIWNVMPSYSSYAASTIAVIVYTYTGATSTVTLRRLSGVVLGKVAGSILQLGLAVKHVAYVMAFATAMWLVVAMTFFQYLHAPADLASVYGLTAAYAAASMIPSNGVLREITQNTQTSIDNLDSAFPARTAFVKDLDALKALLPHAAAEPVYWSKPFELELFTQLEACLRRVAEHMLMLSWLTKLAGQAVLPMKSWSQLHRCWHAHVSRSWSEICGICRGMAEPRRDGDERLQEILKELAANLYTLQVANKVNLRVPNLKLPKVPGAGLRRLLHKVVHEGLDADSPLLRRDRAAERESAEPADETSQAAEADAAEAIPDSAALEGCIAAARAEALELETAETLPHESPLCAIDMASQLMRGSLEDSPFNMGIWGRRRVVAPPELPPAAKRRKVNASSLRRITAADESDDIVEVAESVPPSDDVEVVEAPKSDKKTIAVKSAPKRPKKASVEAEVVEVGEKEVKKVTTDEDFWRVQIEAIYRRRNPHRLAQVASLMEKHKGKELILYQQVCQRYDLNPKKFYADPKSWESEDKDVKDDDDAPEVSQSGVPSSKGLIDASAPPSSGKPVFGASGSAALFGKEASSGSSLLFDIPPAPTDPDKKINIFASGTQAEKRFATADSGSPFGSENSSSLFASSGASSGGLFSLAPAGEPSEDMRPSEFDPKPAFPPTPLFGSSETTDVLSVPNLFGSDPGSKEVKSSTTPGSGFGGIFDQSKGPGQFGADATFGRQISALSDPFVLAKRKIVRGRRSVVSSVKREEAPIAEFPPQPPPGGLFQTDISGGFPPQPPAELLAVSTPLETSKAPEPQKAEKEETKEGPTPGAGAADTGEGDEAPVKIDNQVDFWRVQIEAIYRRRNPIKLKEVSSLMEKHKGQEVILFKKVCKRYDLDPSKIYTQGKEFKDDPDDEGAASAAASAPIASASAPIASIFGDSTATSGGSIFGAATGGSSLFTSAGGTGSLFGASSGGSLFGSGTKDLFGGTSSSSSLGSSIFGTTSSSSAGKSLFGSASSSSFGDSGAFAPGKSLFDGSGNSASKIFEGGNLFAGGSSNLFGSGSGSSTGSLFGAPSASSSSGSSSGSIFGAPGAPPPSTGSIFCGSAERSASGSPFGGDAAALFGSSAAVFGLLMKVLLLFLFVAKAEYFGGSQPSDPVAVVAYLPEWRYEGANWETISEHTTHLLLFSLEMTAKGKIVALDRFPRKELYEQVRQATRKHGTALMICLGPSGPEAAGFFFELLPVAICAATPTCKHTPNNIKELPS
eukprot:g21118.t1